MSALSNMET